MGSRSASGDQRPRRRRNETEVDPGAALRVLVAQVVRPHGLAGALKIGVLSDVPDRFAPGTELYVALAGRRATRARVEAFQPTRGGGLLRLEGIDDRDRAEALRGARLEVDPDQVPDAPEGFYYHFQLIGCRCRDTRHGELGEVVDVVEDGGGTLLAVRGDGDDAVTLLVPFVDAVLVEVDVPGRRIALDLPEGLVETCASKS